MRFVRDPRYLWLRSFRPLGGSSETRNACIHAGLLVGALSGYPRFRQFLPTVGAKRHLFVWGLEGLGLGVWGQWRGCF